MTRADIHDIVLTACILAAVIVAFFAAGFALGWLEASVSLRFVPPWKRKASEPRSRRPPPCLPGALTSPRRSRQTSCGGPASHVLRYDRAQPGQSFR